MHSSSTPRLHARVLCALALTLATFAALVPARARAQLAPFTGDLAAFFDPPTGTSAVPGTLLRYQAFVDAQGQSLPRVYRVLYASTTTRTQSGITHELPILASGLVHVPASAPPAGGFQTLAFTHGTLGMIPECGPSRFGPVWREWMVGETFKTVAADYPGLGVDSGLRSSDANFCSRHPWYFGLVWQQPFDEATHPYTSLEAEARTTIDLVRAAHQLEAALAGLAAPAGDVGTNGEFAVIGSSQGGHAALGTGELMALGYADELELLAVLAGAPGSELQNVQDIDSGLIPAFMPMLLVGASVSHPDVHPSRWMTLVGQANYERTSEEICAGGGDAYAWWIANLGYSYPLNASLEVVTSDPAYVEYALGNSPGSRPIEAPVLVGQVDGDPLIQRARTEAMLARFAAQPQPPELTYCWYDGNGVSGGTTLSLIVAMDNHLVVTDRMYDGQGQHCVGPTGQALAEAVTVESFLAANGFSL